MNKFLALQKDVFDINKITVVGTPTITSDGVASGFDSDNYISKSMTGIDFTKPFKITQLINTSNASSWGTLGMFNVTGWSLGFRYNANAQIVFYLSVGTSEGVVKNLAVQSGVGWYYVTLEWTGSTYILETYDINGNQLGRDTYTSSAPMYKASEITVYYIGQSYGGNYNPFTGGSIDLSQFKIYVDNQLVYTPTKPTYLIERRKPTVWNKGQFDIVGNPSISESGFISNCNGSNYAKISSPITSVNNKFQVDCAIPIGTGVPFVIYIGTAARMFFWRTANNQLRVVLRSTTTDLLDTTVTVPETSLNVKCIVENNTCLVNVNGETLINKTITASAFFEMLNSAEYFTFGSDIGNNPFNQPLDLKTFKIYTDNNLVFDGGADTYVYDPSKFTIYGTPTITDDGIASNFNASNYLIANYKLDMLNAFNFSYEMSTIGYGYIIMIGDTWSGAIVFEIDPESNFVCWLGGTSNKKVITSQATQKQIKNISVDHDGNGNYIIKSIINNTPVEINHTSSTAIGTSDATISLGRLSTNSNTPFTGAIDLPSTSVTVVGKEVFTGAKENYYMLRR